MSTEYRMLAFIIITDTVSVLCSESRTIDVPSAHVHLVWRLKRFATLR